MFYTLMHYCNRLERKCTNTGIINQNVNIFDEIINSQQVLKKQQLYIRKKRYNYSRSTLKCQQECPHCSSVLYQPCLVYLATGSHPHHNGLCISSAKDLLVWQIQAWHWTSQASSMTWRRVIVCEEPTENLPPPCGETLFSQVTVRKEEYGVNTRR